MESEFELQLKNIEYLHSKPETNDTRLKTFYALQHDVFVKTFVFPDKNITYSGHLHGYDHVTLVSYGKVEVIFEALPDQGIPEEKRTYTGPTAFITRAHRCHEITSLEPGAVVSCIHAIRDSDGNVFKPDTHDQDYHNPDYKIPWEEMKEQASKQGKTLPFLTLLDSFGNRINLYKRAYTEGTLKPGTQDDLINE